MNKPFTHKITLALFFVIICQLTLRAQDTAKVILVVRPGSQVASNPIKGEVTSSTLNIKPLYHATPPPQASTIIPTRTAIFSSAVSAAPVSMPSKNALAHPSATRGTVASTPVAGTPTRTGGSAGPSVGVPVKVPSIGLGLSAPSVASAAKPKASQYMAPTTSERTGQPSYLHTPPKKAVVKRVPPAAAVTAPPVAAGPANAGAANGDITAAVAVPVSTAPATNKKDTIIAKTDTATKKDSLIAKKDTTKKDSLLAKKDTSSTDSVNSTIRRIAFLEIGGPGLAISANYDMRVKIGQSDRFGFRAGAGYFQSGNNWVFTIPLQANYLYGKDGKYLEFGLGTTFLVSRGDNYSSKNFIFDKVTGFIATGTIGVRYQPDNGKVNFRLGYVPIIDDDGLVNAAGFSVGYTF